MSHRHCDDFTRAGLLRAAVAEAGRGLPGIEPGMPVPAGTGLTRRSMLMRSAGLALSVYGAANLGLAPLEAGVAEAASHPAQPVLVSVFLEGGIDNLSVLAPTGDPNYRRLRKSLALPDGAGSEFGEDGRLRWHPAAESLATLHREGKLNVAPAIGYDRPDQSHFNSRHFWEVGSLSVNATTGWAGRYLDRVGSADNPLQGLSLDGRLAPALATARVPVAAVGGPEEYRFWSRNVWGEVEGWMLDAIGDIGGAQGNEPGLRAAGTVAMQAGRLREQLSAFAREGDAPAFVPPVPYPSDADDKFPRRLAALAAMLAAGLPLRCVSLNAVGGYDTHDDQAADLEKNLKLTADSLLAFQRDLETRGLADRVLVQVWSEFGRRAEENGSAGTDHGAAGVGFLMGSRVTGRMIGEFPGLDRGLDQQGNLRATSDFRAVYSSILEQWLGTDAAGIVPDAGRVGRPRLIR